LEASDGDFPAGEQVQDLAASLRGLLAPVTAAPTAAASTGTLLGRWLSPLVVKVVISVAMGAGVGGAICVTSTYVNAPRASAPAPMVPPISPASAETPPALQPLVSSETPPPPPDPPSTPIAHGVVTAPTKPAPMGTRGKPRRVELPSADIERGDAERSQPSSEIDLIDRAESMVATRPDQAKRWLQEHVRRFPGGVFEQEREVLFIEAAARAGDAAEAQRQAARFYERFPGTPYHARIEGILRGGGS
jgi:hypothetical protein